MTAPSLIPPEPKAPTACATAIAAVLGAGLGTMLAVVGWLMTGELHWFYAIPIFALVGAWIRRIRPNVLWGNNAH